MQCEEARRRLRSGEDVEAEAHLADCATCFAVLEEGDPLAGVLRAARPEVRAVPATMAAGVLRRWRTPRVSWRLGLAAAAGLLVVATVLAALTVWLAPATVAKPLGVASNALDIVTTIVNGILAVPRVLFADRPAVIAGYAVLVIIVCGLWVRLYQSIAFQRRRVTR
jgi:hypothetical protein